MKDEGGVLAGEIVLPGQKKHYPAGIYQTPKFDVAARLLEQENLLKHVLDLAPSEAPEAKASATPSEKKSKRKEKPVPQAAAVVRRTIHIMDIATQSSLKLPVVDVGRGTHCWQLLLPLGELDYVPALNAQLRATYEFPDGSLTEDLIYLGGSANLFGVDFSVLTLHRMC